MRVQSRNIFLVSVVLGVLLMPYVLLGAAPSDTADVTILELNEQIKDKKNKVESLRRQAEVYQKNIAMRKAQAASLGNQISIIEDDISKTSLDIDSTQTEIEQLDLEVRQTDLNIQQAEAEIGLQKNRLAAFIREMYYNSEKNYLEILLTQNSVSDFFDTVADLERAHTDVKQTLVRIKVLREQLLAQKTSLDQQKKRQEELQDRYIAQKEDLEGKRDTKQQLIVQSTLTASKFQQLLNQARSEQEEIGSQIAELERTAREKLKIISSGPFAFSWPVTPTRGISAYFHDPSYPYRYVFEHPAIDIRAYQGTPVKAIEAGYVGRVRDNGTAYAYVMLIHEKGFASVYGHLSRIIVKQDTYVNKGQVIGLSGGSPGTHGAGPFTTGPHLHLEVRLNGVPVDPLNYLP